MRLKLYKGNVAVVGRESPYSLYDQDLVTFEEGEVAYDQRDAAGFIRLNALRLRTLGQRRKKLEKYSRPGIIPQVDAAGLAAVLPTHALLTVEACARVCRHRPITSRY